uniref:Uncharacterized protein n=1 Tax=Theileria parva TaxID=5875 RepID=Q4N333_THEPA|eukprot:XP_763789.1 hypothetical protein [Theileria parva strain Muguga]
MGTTIREMPIRYKKVPFLLFKKKITNLLEPSRKKKPELIKRLQNRRSKRSKANRTPRIPKKIPIHKRDKPILGLLFIMNNSKIYIITKNINTHY